VLWFGLLSACLVLAVYGRALGAPFVYDDLDQIVNNPSLQSWHATLARFFLAPVSFTNEFFGRPGGATYRPLYWVSLSLDRQLWGIAGVAGFHFTNLFLHWIDGVLLFHLLRRIRVAALTAAAACALWLVLPVNTEAVAWVSGRAYPLSTLFLLLGLLVGLRFLRGPSLALLAGFALLALGAVFSHEQGVLLAPLLILVIWFTRAGAPSARLALLGTAVAADAVYLGAKVRVGAHGGAGQAGLWSVGAEFWRYLGWLFAPVHMSVERSTSLPPNGASISALLFWLALVALLGAAVLLRNRAPLLVFGVGWGCLALLPFCGFVFIYQGMAERFLYLGSIGFVVATVAAAALASPGLPRQASVAVLVLWGAWGAWRANLRVSDWTDPVRLYRNSLEATPRSASLYENLGFALRQAGDLDGALAAYGHALQLQPQYEQAIASIGDIEADRGQFARALQEYAAALRLRPDDPKVLLNNAVALEHLGQFAPAEEGFRHFLALQPAGSAAYVDLGSLYVTEHRISDAIRCFQQGIAANPQDADAYFDLAVVYQGSGQDTLALPLYRKVLALKPGDADTLENMARLHVP
jgi:tetratricopeptide (TPR) repeat protein